jgi:hypothetical protein
MSFERFSSSDVYIFEHVNGFIECCGCWLADWDTEGFPQLKTPREALAHLDRHEEVGHDIGGARRRIEKEYPDLDIEIEPYVRTPEEEARHEALFKRMKEAYDASQKDA